MKLYNVDYFLNKFDAIPEDKWTQGWGNWNDMTCAIGHCGGAQTVFGTVESSTLIRIVQTHLGANVALLNDGHPAYADLGDTPKERIMTALILIKAGVSIQETKEN